MVVLIIDDEPDVIKALKLLLPWKRMGFELVLCATTVSDAQKILQAQHVDIVIIDMIIGDESGLNLAKYIVENQSSTLSPCKIIAISGYEDYSLVRGMFLYGGVDYLLKPIEEEQLRLTVEKAINEIKSQTKDQNLTELLEIEIPIYEEMLLQNYFKREDNNIFYRELAARNSIFANSKKAFLLYSDNYLCPNSSLINENSSDSATFTSVFREVQNLHEFHDSLYACSYKDNSLQVFLILIYADYENVLRILEIKFRNIEELSHHPVLWGKSDFFSPDTSIKKVLFQAKAAYYLSPIYTKNTIIHPFTALPSNSIEKTKDAFASQLRSNQESDDSLYADMLFGIDDKLAKSCLNWTKENLDVYEITLFHIQKIVKHFNELVHQCDHHLSEQYPDALRESKIFTLSLQDSILTKDELLQNISEDIFTFMQNYHEKVQSLRDNNNLMQDIAQYIKKHYEENFDQQSYADLFHINKDYMSRKFKEVLGIGMVQYLNNIRIKKAKELLFSTDMKIFEIADKVGYMDEKYFTKIFKRNCGLSPSAFRQACDANNSDN